MKFFREIRVLLFSIVHSFKSLLWALAMLMVILYIFALVFMHAAAGYVKSDEPDPDVVQEMTLHWGTVHDAMVSLFEAITGGNDWSSYSTPLKEAGEIYFLMFLMYIVFMLF